MIFLVASKLTSINVTVGTLAAGNITGAGNVFLISTNATPGTQTTRTATLMGTDITADVITGFAYRLCITNTGAGDFTLGAGSGVTLTGTMTVPQNTTREFNVSFTSASACTITTVGTGTYS